MYIESIIFKTIKDKVYSYCLLYPHPTSYLGFIWYRTKEGTNYWADFYRDYYGKGKINRKKLKYYYNNLICK